MTGSDSSSVWRNSSFAAPTSNHLISDVIVSAIAGVLVGLSPITTAHRMAPSVAGGLAAAVMLFVYRRWHASIRPERSRGRLLGSRLVVGSACLLFLCLLPSLPELVEFYRESVWRNCHGLLLPLLLIAVTRSILRRKEFVRANGSGWGLVPLVAGLSLMVLDVGIRTLHVTIIGFVLAASGLVCVHYGVRGLVRLSPALGLILFLSPLPSGLGSLLGLPTASAIGAEWMLRLLDYSVLRHASTLDTPNFSFGVSVRCGGWGIFYAALAFAFSVGGATGDWKRSLFLAICAWPFVVFANSLRLAVLIVFCEWRRVSPDITPVHGFSGILAFAIVLSLLLAFAGHRARREILAF